MRRTAVLIIMALAVTVPGQAKPKDIQGIYRETLAEHADLGQQQAFTPAERNLIRAHLLGRQPEHADEDNKALPPGLQKKVMRGKALPPGWQNKVAPGHSLDYQLYRQAESLPDVLLRRLPPPPVGSEILQVENKVVLINAATRTILDVFDLTPTR